MSYNCYILYPSKRKQPIRRIIGGFETCHGKWLTESEWLLSLPMRDTAVCSCCHEHVLLCNCEDNLRCRCCKKYGHWDVVCPENNGPNKLGTFIPHD